MGGKTSTASKNKYAQKAYDRIVITVLKGRREEIDAICNKLGYESRNRFIVDAIEEKISRDLNLTKQ